MATKTKKPTTKPAKGPAKAPVKAKAKIRRKSPSAKAGRVGAKRAELVTVEHLDLDPGLIEASPYQYRRDFGVDDLKSLADSMTNQGQIEPVAVRRVDGRYELLAGERRWRAAVLAGMTTIRAEVQQCTDAQARQIILAENIHRKDLSPIEEAAAYRSIIDAGDVDGPTELARQLGIHQSTVSNRLRLLDLPESWQQRLISREIGERHARSVLSYKDHPAIMAALEETMAEEIADCGDAPSASTWEACVQDIVCQHTRSMDGTVAFGIVFDAKRGRNVKLFEPTPEQAEALGIVKVGDARRATNTELWDRLQEEHLQEIDDQEESPEASMAAATDETDEPDRPADEGDEESNGKDFPSRLWAWKCMFLRHAIASYLRHQASESDLLKIALIVLWRQEFGAVKEGVIATACAKAAGMRPKKDTLGVILVLDDIEAPKATGAVLADAFWTDDVGPSLDIPVEDLLPIAVSIGVDLDAAWAAGDVPSPQGYWDLHTKEQLLAIAKEVELVDTFSTCNDIPKCTYDDLAKMRKADLVATLIRAMTDPNGKETGILMPKEITKAKPPKK